MEKNTLQMFQTAIQYHNDLIWVKPLCDYFDIHVRNQHKKIKNDPILQKLVRKNIPDLGGIDKNGRILLTKKGFIRWIQIINPATIKDELKQKFIQFQSLVMDYLFGNFEKEEQIRVKYNRLNKLKRLRSIITTEMSRCESEIADYMNGRFLQTKLDFTPKQIEQ